MVNFHPAEGVLMVNFYSSIAKSQLNPFFNLRVEFTTFYVHNIKEINESNTNDILMITIASFLIAKSLHCQ